MKQTAYDLCYLAACAVNGTTPKKEKLEAFDLEKLYKISKRHSLSALCAMAVTSAGIQIPSEWQTEKEKAVRKALLFSAEREGILAFMEKSGIWYMPMKGVILEKLYPSLGMREMSDNDILYDKAHQEDLVKFMTARGYKAKSVGKKYHDTFFKEPVYNFEMHTDMFADEFNESFTEYYKDIASRLIPDSGKNYARHLSDDDFYIHITAHEYKHYSRSGTGLRSLLDRYIYIQKKHLNFDYITAECTKLGIEEFEAESRILCQKIFSSPDTVELTTDERDMLESYMLSTAYGTREQKIKQNLKKNYSNLSRGAKLRYVLGQAFPKIEYYKTNYPFAYKCKILLPLAWLIRAVKVLFFKRKTLAHIFRILRHIDDN